MENSNKFLDEVGTLKGIKMAGAESEIKPAIMVNHINFPGTRWKPTREVGEGLCPKCKTMLDLWI